MAKEIAKHNLQIQIKDLEGLWNKYIGRAVRLLQDQYPGMEGLDCAAPAGGPRAELNLGSPGVR